MNKEREFNDNRIKMNKIILAGEKILIMRIFYPESIAFTIEQVIHNISEFIRPAVFFLTSCNGTDLYPP